MNVIEGITALKLFNEKARKLKQLSFTKIMLGQKTGITISGKKGEPVQLELRGPNQESIDAFVLTFRFFIQDNEKSSFRNLADVYNNLPISQQKRDLFTDARTKLNDFLDSPSMFNINNSTLKRRDILDVFVYGGLSHANENKKKIFDAWMKNPLLNPFLKNEFVFILGNVMKVILYVENLNQDVLKELKENNYC